MGGFFLKTCRSVRAVWIAGVLSCGTSEEIPLGPFVAPSSHVFRLERAATTSTQVGSVRLLSLSVGHVSAEMGDELGLFRECRAPCSQAPRLPYARLETEPFRGAHIGFSARECGSELSAPRELYSVFMVRPDRYEFRIPGELMGLLRLPWCLYGVSHDGRLGVGLDARLELSVEDIE